MAAPPTILVFDSGLGGLTVLREIVGARPDAHYVYVADDAFFPYGHHSEEQIIARVVPLVGELIAAHAPGSGGDRLQHRLDAGDVASARRRTKCRSSERCRRSSRPAPVRRPNACRCSAPGHRQARIHQGADPRFRAGLRGDAGRLGRSSPPLAEAALSGVEVSDSGYRRRTRALLCRRRRRAIRPRTDTVVLACTHYPLLMDRFSHGWRHGRSTGSIRRPRSRGALRICSGRPASVSR